MASKEGGGGDADAVVSKGRYGSSKRKASVSDEKKFQKMKMMNSIIV